MSQSEYRPDVDGLRAIAVLAVVAFHAAPGLVPGGFAGVDVFFVISGFLISGIVLSGLSRERFSFVDFYARRVNRIFPALIVMLATVWAFGWLVLLPEEYQLLGRHVASGAAFAENLILYRDVNWYFGATMTPLIHLWSLGVEEQFYLFWPLFLVAIRKCGRGLFIFFAIAAMVSFAVNAAAIFTDPTAAFYLPASRLWELSVGGALAYAQRFGFAELNPVGPARATRSFSWLRLPAQARGLIGASVLIGSFVGLNGTFAFPGWWALVPCGGALLVVSAGPQSWINRHVLAARPIVFIGLISYPLYLWHWPLLSLTHIVVPRQFTPAMAMIAVAAAFILAFLTYRYIECPVRSCSNRALLATGLCSAMIACGGVGYLTFVRFIPARSTPPIVERFARAATEDWLPDTHDTRWTLFVNGFLTVGNGSRRVLYIGDSNMQQYYPRIAKIMADHPLNSHSAVFAVRAACAPAAIEMSETFLTVACKAFLEDAIRYAKDSSVDTIVIGACWSGYFVSAERLGDAGPIRPGVDRALDGLKQLIKELVKEGKRVYIVLQMPIGASFDPIQMVRRTILPPGFTVDIGTPSYAEVFRAVGPIASKLVQVARDGGANVIDPMKSLCDEVTCPAVSSSGEPMYHDDHHLRPSYVRENLHFLDGTVLDGNASGSGDMAPGK
jgi:peptidoglycan/LPS O-acetylase OafA/YrhL